MVSAAARSHIAATLVFVASVLLIAADARRRGVSPSRWRARRGGCPSAGARLHRAAPSVRRHAFPVRRASPRLLVVAVVASFRTLNGLAAGTALLVVMGALKLLESRSRRDDGIVIGVALFLLLAAALATQSLVRCRSIY